MPLLPIRDLGRYGVIKDRAPDDLPTEAWTDACNVRFANGAVRSYSAFKTLTDVATLPATEPQGVLVDYETGRDTLIVVDADTSLYEWSDDVITDVTPNDGTVLTSSTSAPVTSCRLGGVRYVNRETSIPMYRSQSSGTRFKGLTAWDATWRCRSLRKFKDFLFALNVTKGAVNYPNMVKWSDISQPGEPPSNWDTASLTSAAGEKILNELTSEIIDGGELRNSFIVYTSTEVIQCLYVRGVLVFEWRRLFADTGIIAPNCWVEVGETHYVFGSMDVYRHDGNTYQSIGEGRIKEALYRELDMTKADRCFVVHDRFHQEVLFCYPSLDENSPFRGLSNCDKAAVYNYTSDTWTFAYLPNVVAGDEAYIVDSKLWSELTEKWSEIAVSWRGFRSSAGLVPAFVTAGAPFCPAGPSLMVLDSLAQGQINKPILPTCAFPQKACRVKIDLDNFSLPIEGRKLLRRLFPQIQIEDTDGRVWITVGRSSFSGRGETMGARKEYTPSSQYKYDTRTSGRYLSLTFEIEALKQARFSGYDADIEIIGMR